MNKMSWVRTVYLYLFSLVGLTLLIIGGVRLINLGLKVFIFKQADQQQAMMQKQPLMPPYGYKISSTTSQPQVDMTPLTADERAALDQWVAQYNDWKIQNDKYDFLTGQRQQDVSLDLSMIIVGLPLFAWHWRLARRENKERNA